MAKKIMIVTGSPRKGGNTMTLAAWVAEGAREAGAEVEIVNAAALDYKTNGCTACNGCQESEKYGCIIKDEASPIIARIPEMDVLVLATPIYFMGFSAQIKLLLDRFYSLMKINPEDHTFKHELGDMEWALIASGGGDEGSGLGLVEANMNAIAGFFQKKPKVLKVPFAPAAPGEIDTNLELKDKALDFGQGLSMD
jgi:multimeric flavodoxin WrbA